MKIRPAVLLSLLFSFLLLSQSCITGKDISYFQNVSDSVSAQKITQDFEAIIQTGDILSIHVKSLSAEMSSFFNVVEENSIQQVANTYLVNATCNIEMPLIESVKVAGNTRQVGKYLVVPSVNLRIRNFKVKVVGVSALSLDYELHYRSIAKLATVYLDLLKVVEAREKASLLRLSLEDKVGFVVMVDSPSIIDSEQFDELSIETLASTKKLQ